MVQSLISQVLGLKLKPRGLVLHEMIMTLKTCWTQNLGQVVLFQAKRLIWRKFAYDGEMSQIGQPFLASVIPVYFSNHIPRARSTTKTGKYLAVSFYKRLISLSLFLSTYFILYCTEILQNKPISAPDASFLTIIQFKRNVIHLAIKWQTFVLREAIKWSLT